MILDAVVKDIKADSGEFTVKRSSNYSDIVNVFIDNGYMILIENTGADSITINFWKKEI